MATVEAYETKAGRRYRVRYRTPEHRSTDKRGFKTKRDAEAFAATVEVSKLRGEYIDTAASRTTVGQLGPEWLGRQSHLKPSSLRPVESAWNVHVEKRWGDVAVSDIRRTAVQQWVADIGAVRAPTTVIRAHGVLASILDDSRRSAPADEPCPRSEAATEGQETSRVSVTPPSTRHRGGVETP